METPSVSPSSVSGPGVPSISTSPRPASSTITRPGEVGTMPSGEGAQRQIDKNASALKSSLREMGGKIVEVFSKLPMKYLVITASAGFVLAMVVPLVLLLSTLLSGGGALVVVGLYVAMLVLAGSALVASVGAGLMILELATGLGNSDEKSQQRGLQHDPVPIENRIDEHEIYERNRALAQEEALRGSGFESKPPSNPEKKRAEGKKKLDPPVSSPKPDRPALTRSLSFNKPKAAIPMPPPPERTISVAANSVVTNATAEVAKKTIEAMQKEVEVFSAVFKEGLREPAVIPAPSDAAPAPVPINQGHEEVTELVRVVLQVEQTESQEPPPVEKEDISKPIPVLSASPQAAAEPTAKIPGINVRGVDLSKYLDRHSGPLLREYLETQNNKFYILPKFRALQNIRVTAQGSDYNLAQFAELLTIPEKRRLLNYLKNHYNPNKKIT